MLDKDETSYNKEESFAIRRGLTGMAPGLPQGPGVHGFSALHVSHAQTPAFETAAQVFLIVYRGEDGSPKLKRFNNEPLAQAFIGELLSQGISRQGIEAYRASELDFQVDFRPIVRFKSS